MKTYHKLLLALVVLAGFVAEFIFLADTKAKHWWNHVPAFYALWGFVSCVLIIYVSKWLGKVFIQTREDYYDAQ